MQYRIREVPRRYLTPPVDIYETDEEIVIIADMPGVSKDRAEVNAAQNRLTILGHIKKDRGGRRLIRECPLNDYYRSFKLSNAIDVENIQAKILDGVLKLTLPKKVSKEEQRISIETE